MIILAFSHLPVNILLVQWNFSIVDPLNKGHPMKKTQMTTMQACNFN